MAAPRLAMRSHARDALERRLRSRMAELPAPRRTPVRPRWAARRWVSVVAAAVVVAAISFATAAAAAASLPGDWLYPVKRWSESVALQAARDATRVYLRLEWAQRRLNEFQALTARGVVDVALLDEFEAETTAAIAASDTLGEPLRAEALGQVAAIHTTAIEVVSSVRDRALEPQEGSAWTPEIAAQAESRRRRPVGTRARRWWWAFGVLLAACLLYPLTATPVRIGDRFKDSLSLTLDGSAYMRTSVYQDEGRPITLDWDRQALDWLRQNVHGMPTIVEANTPLYRWGARVSIYTGLPTVIGWDWHQKQQRSVLPGQTIDRRIEDVRTIYTSTDPSQTMRLLDQYRVQYIYVGPLERIYYAGNGLDKFDQPNNLWNLVYQNEQVKVYQVH